MATKRIAFARINQETNALSPLATELSDFAHLSEGDELLRACRTDEVPGFMRRAELSGFVDGLAARHASVEPVPLLSAWAIPSGPLTRDAFDVLRGRLVERLRKAGRIDALYLALHGAMGCAGIADPEHALIVAAREVIGGAPIFVSYDLHANMTAARIGAADALQSYQTNPHRDHARIGRRAARVLLGMLEGTLRPTIAWRRLPMVIGGGTTIDFFPTMLPVFARMKTMEWNARVLGTSVNMCHPWSDHPSLGWSTVAMTNGDRPRAERLAGELAEMCVRRKHVRPPRFASPSQAIASARRARWARKLGTVMMVDASDIVGAGAPGENTALVRALLEEGDGLLAYAPIRDPGAVNDLFGVAEGREVETTLGGKLDPVRSAALPVRGRILHKAHQAGFGRTVVLAVDHVRLVVTEGPPLAMHPSFYTDVGLDPWRADVVVVKNFFPFLLHFAHVNRKAIFVRTSGVTDFGTD